MPNITRLAAQVTVSLLKLLLARLEPGDRSWLARHVVAARQHPEVCALIDFSYGAIRGWKNSEFDITTNGEAALLKRLSRFSPHTVIDVGANRGDWSLAALRYLPNATVHAFEIAPATFEKLVENTRNSEERLIINRLGLSDVNGKTKLYYTPESDTASSLISEAMSISTGTHKIIKIMEVDVEVVRGDDYMSNNNIAHIEILKIDVEGAELSVLKGFSDAISKKRIDIIQFEYGLVNLKTRIFLEDFYDFFESNGYIIGKIFPNGVGFKPFTIHDEDFIGLNFVACRKERTDLIAAIRCAPVSLDTLSLPPRS